MKIKNNIKLAKYTTFHIGGPAKFFIEVNSVEELKDAVSFGQENKLSLFILGGGSNLLMPDKGIDGLVIRINIKGIKFHDNILSAGAGEKWDEVVAKTISRGLWGIENLSLIPGTVGGAVYQNIGAYGAELKDALHSVEVFDINSQSIKKISNRECCFGYRKSIFQQKERSGQIIIGANLVLSREGEPNLKYPDLANFFENKNPALMQIRKAVMKIRRSKLVYPTSTIGTAGSFYKNPVILIDQFNQILKNHPDIKGREAETGIKLSAGQLIEKVGWKGKRVGQVGVSGKHALVLVSHKNTQALNIIKLSDLIRTSVKNKFGIELEPEVKIVP